MSGHFQEIKKNFGFGCMRLPMKNDDIDYEEFSKMIKAFFNAGFNYFDTAHGYIQGKSEVAIKDCLTSKYKRDSYVLTNKLTSSYFEKEEDILPFFEKQLEICGVNYFDFYLMHAQNEERYKKYKKCHAYEIANGLKKDGKIHHLGISFHDKADVLDTILKENPEIELVQIQFNYLDYEDEKVQSRKCYEVCEKYNKRVAIMEPVKGGSLINLPTDAQKILDSLHGGSNASYAIRFAASFPLVTMVLSGMSNLSQMKDNLSYMKGFIPFSKNEFKAINKVREILLTQDLIPCTACRYCIDGCPKHIQIPDLFSCLNNKRRNSNYDVSNYQKFTLNHGKASECIKCGKCERICPQNLKIRELLETVKIEFEK